MNLLLLAPEEISDRSTARLLRSDRRAVHICQVLKLQPGDNLKVGVIGGNMGVARYEVASPDSLTFSLVLDQSPPPPLDLTLIVGLPRPKTMRRVIQSIAALGVKDLILLNTYKVEKSYWQSPWLQAETLHEQCLLGLEQAMDTAVPRIRQFKLFKPFVEDTLPEVLHHRSGWFAHPKAEHGIPSDAERLVLAIGPEGGFTPYEVGKLTEAGMQGFHLGPRILRVETVIPSLVGRLFL